ncbi:MAG: response regulator [Proteobacteria bacterium]|nr:response regulator [Pseudomonadota bacterium]MCP4918981.1 response regulator [Pseudomonadota bacterium]
MSDEISWLRAELERAVQQLPRLCQLVEFSTDMLVMFDAQMTVIDCNRAATEALGLPRHGLHGSDLDGVLDTHALRGLVGELAPPARRRITLELTRADGTSFPAELNVTSFESDGAKLFLAAGHDITERRRLEERARQVERMQAVGILASGVAHEINNPLAYATMNLEYALDQLGSDTQPETVSALDDALHGLERVKRIVQDLSVLSRPHDGTQSADVCAAIGSAIDMSEHQLRHRAELVLDLDDLPRVQGDESRISQVLLNLLMNAAHTIEPGDAADNRVVVRGHVEREFVCVEVEDTGAGIPADVIDRVFEPFFTTRGLTAGSGLGLAISRETVLSIGGRLVVESTEGEGTRATVWLPLSTAEPAPAPLPEVAAKLRLLVVDDEPRLAAALGRLLGADHVVTAVTSGREALQLVEAGEPLDAVLCDVMMPDLDGRAVYARLLQMAPELARRTVFMTGGAMSEGTRAFVEEMADRCLTKPFSPERVAELLAEHG